MTTGQKSRSIAAPAPLLAAALLVALAAGLGPGCRLNGPKPDGSGTIECTQVLVSPEVAGRIVALPPREGAAIRKGDLVARLDPADHELRREEARAALAHAQAQLDLIVAGSRDEDVQRGRDQLREAEAAAKAAAADRQRLEQAFLRHAVTQKQADDARSLADRMAAAQSAAEQALVRLLRGNRQEEVRMAQAVADQARARLAQIEKTIADCTVVAPTNGVVTIRAREEGEFVGAGAPLITISRLDEVWLSIYVPEARLGFVKLGQPAHVRIDGDPRAYEGVVTFIASEAEFTPRNVQTPDERTKLVYRVKITLPNPNGTFKPGMPADGYLDAAAPAPDSASAR